MDNVLEQAAAVACSLARALEPSFGPLCRDQVLTGADGRTALTCHGAAILRALTVQLRGQHACARLIEAVAVHMDATHGDGATATVAMLAAALSAVSSLFPASPAACLNSNSAAFISSAAASLPTVSVSYSNATASSSLDSTLSDRLAVVLDARRATARQRVLRLAAALRRLRADELPRMLMTTAHSVRLLFGMTYSRPILSLNVIYFSIDHASFSSLQLKLILSCCEFLPYPCTVERVFIRTDCAHHCSRGLGARARLARHVARRQIQQRRCSLSVPAHCAMAARLDRRAYASSANITFIFIPIPGRGICRRSSVGAG
jgi:hypothetical protein